MKIILILKILIFTFIFIFINFSCVSETESYITDNIITVYSNEQTGKVNKYVFGNNILAYDPSKISSEEWAKKYMGYSEYGAGIWDSNEKQYLKDAVILARNAGISILRYPGGCGVHGYNWKDTIGADRKRYTFGLDEFFEISNEIGADSVITVSYFTGDESDAADLVEYLNGTTGKWAKLRIANGHLKPYDVKYFEIGNEVWHGDHKEYEMVSAQDYGQRYIKYFNAMKSIDSKIEIGVVLYDEKWNNIVIPIIKNKVDFGILHTYPSPGWNEKLKTMPASEIYRISLGYPIVITEPEYQNTLGLLKKHASHDVPLAITEFNGGFAQDKPIPYRHCLGTALINAELLRIFMKPENNILMANYWNFANEYWGMISNNFDGDYKDLSRDYFKRPNYYVFELYHNYFGDLLLKTDVKSSGYTEQGYTIPYLTVNTSTDLEKNNIYLIVINKNLEEAVSANIEIKDFGFSNDGQAWVLNGEAYTTLNEKNPDNVKIRHINFKAELTENNTNNDKSLKNKNTFTFKFEPHSLTAIKLIKEIGM